VLFNWKMFVFFWVIIRLRFSKYLELVWFIYTAFVEDLNILFSYVMLLIKIIIERFPSIRI